MFAIPQSTSFVLVFKAFLSTDHITEATGKTIAITISKAGGAFGNPNAGATNATEISAGWYKVTLDTTDTGTLGIIAIRGAVSGIDDFGDRLFVVKATNGGLTALPDTAVTTNASLVTAGTGTSQISVSSGQVILQTGTGTGQLDFTSGIVKANVAQLLGTAWLTPGTAGTPDVNAKLHGGTSQTGRDIGASVLLSTGTGTGQLDFTSGVVKANATQWLGGTIPAVNVTGVPLVDLKYTLGTLSPAAAGSVAIDWAQVSNKTSTVALTGTTIATTQKVDVDTIKTNPVVNGGTVTFPTSATLASTTNITAGTITTVTTVTNQLTAAQIATGVWQDTTAGDFTTSGSIGKSLFTSGVLPGASGGLFVAGTNAATTITTALTTTFTGNLTGNVGGNVTGSIGSLATQAKADVNAEADTALADYDAPTHTELTAELATADDAVLAAIAALNNLSQANIRSAIGLGSANLDTQLAAIDDYVDTEVAAILTAANAIKLKTDSMTFTVAGKLDANILYVNGIQVKGSGTAGDPWNPV